MTLKKDIRRIYRQKRLSLSAQERKTLSASIVEHLLGSDMYRDSRVVHLFLPIESKAEVDTMPLLRHIWDGGKKAVVSVSDFTTSTMSHFYIDDSTVLSANGYGIPEPVDTDALKTAKATDIDMVLVPLLACDTRGMRVGYGKGFYDRFLSEISSSAYRVGLSFFQTLDGEISDATPQDIPLTHLVTPSGIIKF